MKISRQAYADMFGPTVGDKVRLADTSLWIEVEKDFTTHGDEVKFGGGKVIRDGMGQSQLCAADVVDTVITNALIIDHWGIVKADVGLKGGRIAAIGKAGNPDIQPGVSIAIGGATEVIAGEGMIVTAGGIDSHIHFICPQQIEEALASGVTTMIGGGTGRDVAMVLGTVGGAFAGHAVQQRYEKPVPGQQIIVRTTNGVLVSVTQPANVNLRQGQKVYIEGSGEDARVVAR